MHGMDMISSAEFEGQSLDEVAFVACVHRVYIEGGMWHILQRLKSTSIMPHKTYACRSCRPSSLPHTLRARSIWRGMILLPTPRCMHARIMAHTHTHTSSSVLSCGGRVLTCMDAPVHIECTHSLRVVLAYVGPWGVRRGPSNDDVTKRQLRRRPSSLARHPCGGP